MEFASKKKEMLTKKVKWYGVDSVSSWVVAFGSCWVMFFTMGLFRSYGILFVTIMQQFGVNRQDASWPFSLCGTMQNMGGLLPGLINLIPGASIKLITFVGGIFIFIGVSTCYFAQSISWLTVFFGLFYGLGSGIIIPSQPVLLTRCFKKYRASACGICFAGAALSSMIFPVLGEELLNYYGLNGTFLVFGGLLANVVVGASLLSFESIPQRVVTGSDAVVNSTKDEVNQFCESDHLLSTSKSDTKPETLKVENEKPTLSTLSRELLSDSLFYFTALSSSTGWLCCFTFAMVVVDFGLDQGLPKNQAVLLIIVYSGTEFAGRLCSGWLSDSGLIKRKNVVLYAASLSGCILCLFPFVRTSAGLFFITGVYGLLVGSQIIIYYVLMADYISAEKIPLAVSLAFSFGGSFSLIRPAVVGIIRDKRGSYDELFYILGGLSLLGGIIWLLEPWVLRRRTMAKETLENGV